MNNEIIYILSVIVTHDNRDTFGWMRFDSTHRTLRKSSPSYDTAREQQESGNTAKERSTVVFVSLCPRIPVPAYILRATHCEVSLALNGGGRDRLRDINLVLNAAATHLKCHLIHQRVLYL